MSDELKRILAALDEDYYHPSFGKDDVVIIVREAYGAGVAEGRRQSAAAIRKVPWHAGYAEAAEIAARLAEAAHAESGEDDGIRRLLRDAYEADPWTDAQEAEYRRLDSLSLECQQRACGGCDGLSWGPGNQPCAHDCHNPRESTQ